MFDWVALDHLKAEAPRYRDAFAQGLPFRHLVFDQLVHPAAWSELVASFPDTEWSGWKNISHEHQYLKQSCNRAAEIPAPLRALIFELSSGPFISWLSEVTAIPRLLPDPHLRGGGLHVSGPGGTLTPHTDFHVMKGSSLFRRLNLLFYLNDGWTAENGGQLELWNKKADRIEKTVLPSLGTCVIFETDSASMHGFMTPVAARNRQSVALYYYTAEDADHYSGDDSTHWRFSSVEGGSQSWLRLRSQATLMFASRAFSGLAWRAAAMAERLGARP